MAHAKLLSLLKSYVVASNNFNVTLAFITEKRQCVCINYALPSFLPVLSSVPQGSVLGSLYF